MHKVRPWYRWILSRLGIFLILYSLAMLLGNLRPDMVLYGPGPDHHELSTELSFDGAGNWTDFLWARRRELSDSVEYARNGSGYVPRDFDARAESSAPGRLMLTIRWQGSGDLGRAMAQIFIQRFCQPLYPVGRIEPIVSDTDDAVAALNQELITRIETRQRALYVAQLNAMAHVDPNGTAQARTARVDAIEADLQRLKTQQATAQMILSDRMMVPEPSADFVLDTTGPVRHVRRASLLKFWMFYSLTAAGVFCVILVLLRAIRRGKTPSTRSEPTRSSISFDKDHLPAALSSAPAVIVTVVDGSDGVASISGVVRLALALARSGRSVLLVETDPADESISMVFDIPGGSGWAEFLTGEPLSDCLLESRVPGLSVMSRGDADVSLEGGSVSVSELVLDDHMDELSGMFDVTLLYSPDVFALTASDSGLIASDFLLAVDVNSKSKSHCASLVRDGSFELLCFTSA